MNSPVRPPGRTAPSRHAPEEQGEIGMVAWEPNDFMDLATTDFKERNICFERVSRGIAGTAR